MEILETIETPWDQVDDFDLNSFSLDDPDSPWRSVCPKEGGSASILSQAEEQLPESTHFAVSTDVDCLFWIGKISAKHNVNIEKGLNCLSDFLLILDHKRPEMDSKTYFKMRSNSLYYIGTLYFLKGDKAKAESYYRDVYFDLMEVESNNFNPKSKNWKSEKIKKIEMILAQYFWERFIAEKHIV